jgi:hypothetical protein
MNMKYKLTALTLILALSTIMMSPAIAAAQVANTSGQQSAGFAIPFNTMGTLDGTAVNVAGIFNLQKFAVQEGKLVGIGTLTATAIDPTTQKVLQSRTVAGMVVPVISASTVPAAGAQQASASQISAPQPTAVCDILNLVLGPLHLDLLGLVVDLNQVVLNITAESGAGNLLGNLLCAVAGLLDQNNPSLVQQIANLLNQILSLLG